MIIQAGRSYQETNPNQSWGGSFMQYGALAGDNMLLEIPLWLGISKVASHFSVQTAQLGGHVAGMGFRGAAMVGTAMQQLAGKQAVTAAGKAGAMTTGAFAKGMVGTAASGLNALFAAHLHNMITAAPGMVVGGFAGYGLERYRKRRRKELGDGLEMYGQGWQDNQVAATMRQAGLMHLQESSLGIRRAFSREAFFMHK